MSKSDVEIERKYIIALPDDNLMSSMQDYTVSSITQIYVSSPPRITHRVRLREYNGKIVCTETKKVRLDSMSSIEDEREISEEEFRLISENIADGTIPVKKVRHTFVYDKHTFEVDVYPQWTESCILETELSDREERVEFPDFIKIIKEVTGIKEYSNASMARAFPEEIK